MILQEGREQGVCRDARGAISPAHPPKMKRSMKRVTVHPQAIWSQGRGCSGLARKPPSSYSTCEIWASWSSAQTLSCSASLHTGKLEAPDPGIQDFKVSFSLCPARVRAQPSAEAPLCTSETWALCPRERVSGAKAAERNRRTTVCREHVACGLPRSQSTPDGWRKTNPNLSSL